MNILINIEMMIFSCEYLKVYKMKIKMIKTNFIQRLKMCWKILKTKGFSEDYTIKELIEDEY